MTKIYNELNRRLLKELEGKGVLSEKVHIKARPLSAEGAIGNPEADDFPLQKGKERLMQAEFRGALGQAFTDQYGDFEGILAEVLEMPLRNNYRRALFAASLNAVLRFLGLIDGTVHCRDQEPALCAQKLSQYIGSNYGKIKIAQIGFQPRMVEVLSLQFDLRVSDLDPANVGTTRFNTLIEGPEASEDLINWADLLLVTGTTLVNATIDQFLNKKPILFYGTTIAGAAHIMGWDQFCVCSR